MAETGTLTTDPLFLGLTRPPMIFGVSYMMVALNGLGSMIYMINTSDILGMAAMLFSLHGIGYVICFKEPLFIQLYLIRGQKCMKCKNRMYHGSTNSYEVY